MMARVLVPLPRRDFDPSEAAIPWQALRAHGIEVVFATPDGRPAQADPQMLSGQGLDLWGWIPGLRRLPLLGLALRADRRARMAYAAMERSVEFQQPQRWDALDSTAFAGLLLPGGHWARGVREYLESPLLQALVAEFFRADKAVAAVCHGVVLAARSIDRAHGRSVLHGRRTTALTWSLERSAWNLSRWLGRVWEPDYYRTYREAAGEPVGYRSVQAEVTRALARAEDFLDVPADSPHGFRQRSGLFRDRPGDERPAWVVCDGHYVSARWPGDLHRFSRLFCEQVQAVAGRD